VPKTIQAAQAGKHRHLEALAFHRRMRRTLIAALRTWRDATEAQARLHRLAHSVQARSKRRAMSAVLSAWQKAHNDQISLQRFATDLHQVSRNASQLQLRQLFDLWRHRRGALSLADMS
jgi:hypothetical protein